MEPSVNAYIAVVLVDHKFQAHSDIFLVDMSPNDIIYRLKEKVKEQWHRDPKFAHFDFTNLAKLVVWKTMGAKVISKRTHKNFAAILSTINVDDGCTIQRLSELDRLADLGLKDFQALLVQLPGTSRISTIVGRVFIQVKLLLWMIAQLETPSWRMSTQNMKIVSFKRPQKGTSVQVTSDSMTYMMWTLSEIPNLLRIVNISWTKSESWPLRFVVSALYVFLF
jgi:hypothetical protein